MAPANNACKNWCFTLNNPTDEDIERISSLQEGQDAVQYVLFGNEVGDSGTPHLQGFISLTMRKRFTFVKLLLGGDPHVEACRNVCASIEYCKKDGDFKSFGDLGVTSGKRTDLDVFKEAVKSGMVNLKELREGHSGVMAQYRSFAIDYIMDNSPEKELANHPYRPWQNELKIILDGDPDDRSINFIVDTVGNTGKTWFSHHFSRNNPGCQVMEPARKADMAYALDTTIRVLFLDCSRCKADAIQYDFLEHVKNGYVFSSKYESRQKILGKCHVVVMMNELPNMVALSEDRYAVIEI